MHVIIVGAGVLGASLARQLARRGSRVHVFDQHPTAASGVSGASFGWVNLIHGDPRGKPQAYQLRMEAVAEFARFARDFDDPAWCRHVGALVWLEDVHTTQQLIECHRLAGAAIWGVEAREILAIEPKLIAPPPWAAYCPDDYSVDVAAMVRALLDDARVHGAVVALGEGVLQIEPANGTHTTVVTTTGTYHADIVVLANAIDANLLLRPLGAHVPISTSPAVLMRLATRHHLVHGIVNGPTLEIRQDPDRTLTVAEAPHPSGDDHQLVALVTQEITATFGPVSDLALTSVVRAGRPLPRTSMPIVGLIPGLPGIYAMVAHPGVILAPLLARAVAAELLDGRREPLLEDWAAESARS